MTFLPSYAYFIAISLLVSLSVFFKPVAPYPYLRLFPPFLLLTLVAESLGSYWSTIGKNNLALYNFFSTFEFCFYFLLISFIISSRKIKKIIWVSTVLYAATAIINILFIQKMKTFHTTTYAVGCLLVVAFCIYYFFEVFKFPKSGKLQHNPAFWICSGLLFFYCCGFPLYGLVNLWSQHSKLLAKNFLEIVTILNIFLYSLFTIGFLCIRIRKYTLSPLLG